MHRSGLIIPIALVLSNGASCPPVQAGGTVTGDPTGPRKVAVLISTQIATTRDVDYDADFWYDTVLTYCMLRQNGFSDDDIYVLYGDGTDGFYIPTGSEKGSSAEPPAGLEEEFYIQPYCGGIQMAQQIGPLSVDHHITDFPMTYNSGQDDTRDGRCRPRDIFDCLKDGCDPLTTFDLQEFSKGDVEPLDGDDLLFVWWKGHGVRSSENTVFLGFTLPWNTLVTIDEIKGWVAGVPAGRRVVVWETCYAGCLEPPLEESPEANTTVILASSGCEETSTINCEIDVTHGLWSFWMASVLHGMLPDGSSQVRLKDGAAIDVTLARGGPLADSFTESSKGVGAMLRSDGRQRDQHPKIKDPGDLAPMTRIDVDDPVGDQGKEDPPLPRPPGR